MLQVKKGKLEQKEKQSLLYNGKIRAITQHKNRINEMLKDIEKSKNPKSQLKKANTSLEKVINLQKYQQSQILSENDECTKVSKILSLPRTIIPANQTSIESIIKGASEA